MTGEDDFYSLLDEPWIACVNGNGMPLEVSIREVFDGSREIVELRGDSPAQDYAILRLLLAIYWRAHSVQKTVGKVPFSMARWFTQAWREAQKGAADTKVLSYVDGYAERFRLFDAKAPFMQVADLQSTSGQLSTVKRIVPDIEDEFFTMRAGQARETLTFAEAARWLVYIHAYDYSGIKSGAVGDARVKNGKGYPIGTGWTGMTGGTFLRGANLRETLALNTVEDCIRRPGDKPVWEREPDTAAERNGGAILLGGPADLATWQTRRVRLHREDGQVCAVLVSNGDQIPNAGLNAFGDPMTPYRYSKQKSKKGFDAFYPRPYDSGRTMWKSIEPLIAMESDLPFLQGAANGGKNFQAPKRPEILDQLAYYWRTGLLPAGSVAVSMVSVEYGPQASSVASSISASASVNPAVLEDDQVRRAVLNAATVTLDAAIQLGKLAGDVLVAAGGSYEFQSAPTDSSLAEMEPAFNRWLDGWSSSTDHFEHCLAWQRSVQSFLIQRGEAVLQSAGPRALIGRPDPRSTAERPPIVTAATYFSLFTRRLRDALPLLDLERSREEKVVTHD